MAIATYNTDLSLISDAEDITVGPWDELNGHTSGGAETDETDYYIQASQCVSQSTGTKTGTVCGLQVDYGSDIAGSMNTGDCFFIWHTYLAANAIQTWSNGGLRFGVGSSAGNMNYWNSVGSDFGRNPYGGWQNVAVDPTYVADSVDGSPTAGVYQFFGSLPNIVSAVSKGNPHGVDAIRYGRGQIYIELGEASNYGTFSGMATTNDNINNRWGLFQEQAGSYLWKGLMSLGTASNAVDFRDSNRTIAIDDCPRTYKDFNKIEINNTSSNIEWDSIAFSALGITASGILEVVDDATVTFDGCNFSDMSTFTFKSNSTITNCIFQRCNEITTNSGIFTGTKVLTSAVDTGTSAINWESSVNPDGYLDNMEFTKGTNSHHAIEFGVDSATTITLNGMSFTGFNTSDAQTDSVIHILRDSGSVTIQAVECIGTVSYLSAGATVTVTQGVVTNITVKDIDTGSVIEGARVLVQVADGTNFPYLDSVNITSAGTVATVTHTDHGLTTNDNIIIRGANEDAYNGVYTISGTGASTYTYSMNEDPASPATGTITSTLALINTTTNAQGVANDQRTIAIDQPITGWVRYASGSPYYKQQPISDTVDNATGKDIVVQLIKDE